MDNLYGYKVDLFLQILKFSSLAIATASGLIGTLRETRKNGTEKLTNSGRILVGLLIMSGIIAIGSQSVESYINYKADKKREAEHQKQVEYMQNILSQASRQLAHLFPFDVSIQISYPRNYKGFKAYFDWLEKRHRRPNRLVWAITVQRGSSDAPDASRNSLEYPATVLLEPWIEMSLFKKGNSKWNSPDLVLMGGVDLKRPDLWLGAYGGVGIESMQSEYKYSSNASFTYSLVRNNEPVISNLVLRNPLIERDNGQIFSYLDLDNAILIIDITNSRHAKGVLDRIKFTFKTGRLSSTIVLSPDDLVEWEGYRDDKEKRTVYKIRLKSSSAGISRSDLH